MRLYLPIAAIIVGCLAIAVLYRAEPRFSDEGWQRNVPEGDSTAYYLARSEALNPRAARADAARGGVVLGLSVVCLFGLLGVRGPADLRALQTPRSRWPIFLFANLVWATSWFFAAAWGLSLWQDQQAVAPWEDSGMAFVVPGATTLMLTGVPPLNLTLFLLLRRVHLPAPLWAPPSSVWQWVVAGSLAALALGLLLDIGLAVRDGDLLVIPPAVLGFYTLASIRAAFQSGAASMATAGAETPATES